MKFSVWKDNYMIINNIISSDPKKKGKEKNENVNKNKRKEKKLFHIWGYIILESPIGSR